MATLLSGGTEVCPLEEFDTWVELGADGPFTRRCMFAIPAGVAVDPAAEDLAVALDDGSVWTLKVGRSIRAAQDPRLHVTSAILREAASGSGFAAA